MAGDGDVVGDGSSGVAEGVATFGGVLGDDSAAATAEGAATIGDGNATEELAESGDVAARVSDLPTETRCSGGKRDEDLILPVNGSISVTLGIDELQAKTSVAISKSFEKDRIWLNGREEDITNSRLQKCLKEMRRRAHKRKAGKNEEIDLLSGKIHICSENNFPTAAGLASSAAGYACLVFSLAKLFNIESDISEIARQGSGSACRSMYGGFVQWVIGKEKNGSDSIAKQIEPHTYWPELNIIILVVSDQKKSTSSTSGMETSISTSSLLPFRTASIVPDRLELMIQAIVSKDFQQFAQLTIKDSNQFHAICLDTYPPIFYLNDTSKHIIQLVHKYNETDGNIKVAYTFDAGPNACLFLLEESVLTVMALIKHYYPNVSGITSKSLPFLNQEMLDSIKLPIRPDAVLYVIHTKAGPGPQLIDDSDHLLNENGQPKLIK